jgi:hypothetical protein
MKIFYKWTSSFLPDLTAGLGVLTEVTFGEYSHSSGNKLYFLCRCQKNLIFLNRILKGWVACLHSLWLPWSWLSCKRCACRIWKHQQHGQSMRCWAQMMFMSFLWTLSKSTLPRSVLWLFKGLLHPWASVLQCSDALFHIDGSQLLLRSVSL